eukprot:UN09696
MDWRAPYGACARLHAETAPHCYGEKLQKSHFVSHLCWRSAHAQSRALIWCVPINFPDQGDTF